MAATQVATNNSKSVALKVLSVVGLAIFTGFYAQGWQRSLSKHYAEQEQKESVVASAAANVSQPKREEVDSVAIATPVETVPAATAVNATVEVAPEISDPVAIKKLTDEVYSKIDGTWRQIPSFSENLVYQVTVTKDGAIAKYQHINKAGMDYIQETPLPQLVNFADNSAKAVSQAPTANLLVVLAPTGKLQVSPWVAK